MCAALTSVEPLSWPWRFKRGLNRHYVAEGVRNFSQDRGCKADCWSRNNSTESVLRMCRTPGSKSAGRKVVLGSCTQVEGPFLAPCRAARLAQAARGPLRQPEPQLRDESRAVSQSREGREPSPENRKLGKDPHDGWRRLGWPRFSSIQIG